MGDFRTLTDDATLAARRVLAVLLNMNARPGLRRVTAAAVAKRVGRFATDSEVNTVASANPTLIDTTGGLQLTNPGLAEVRKRPQPRSAIH